VFSVGLNTNLPESMSTLDISCPNDTWTPDNNNIPFVGSVSIFTFDKSSLVVPKSDTVKT